MCALAVLRLCGLGRGCGRQPPQCLFDEGSGAECRRSPRASYANPIRWQVRCAERDRHDECAAPTQSTLHLDRAAMQGDQFADQRQTDPRALVGAALYALDAMEAIEDTLQVL